MFCGKCGVQNDDGASFCKACGAALTGRAFASPEAPPIPKERSSGPLKKILYGIGAVVALVILIFVITGSRSPVNNFKDIVFDDYTSEKIGKTTEQVFRFSPKWKYQKVDSDHYLITVSGFFDELNMNIDAVFDYYDYGEYCYAVIDHAVVNGQTYNDNLSLRTVMAILCNNLDMADRLLTQSILSSLLGW